VVFGTHRQPLNYYPAGSFGGDGFNFLPVLDVQGIAFIFERN
jgi:hypothetical protein